LPVRALALLARELADRADEACYGEETLHTALAALHADYESGRIGEEEFDRREAELLATLAEAARRKRRNNR
jgi:gas vesicle protein GvpG